MLQAKAVLNVFRPKQWAKNLLVLAALIASTELLSNSSRLLIALLGFTRTSVFGYLINDWFDGEIDFLHLYFALMGCVKKPGQFSVLF
jgi:4-hydroxybenzoate polyprenyltransferase